VSSLWSVRTLKCRPPGCGGSISRPRRRLIVPDCTCCTFAATGSASVKRRQRDAIRLVPVVEGRHPWRLLKRS